MKKSIILTAAAVVVLASCAKIESPRYAFEDELIPVDYSVYVPKTKAGEAGEMDNAKLQSTGFGVFAYENAGTYAAGLKPNFMYNQEVTYSSSAWSYSPIKYWPNQIAANAGTDSQSPAAVSAAAHTVSFFAYAPYVSAASGTEGITAMSANSDTGDPTLTYKVSDDLDKNVDLVWGTSNGAVWNNVAGGTNTVAEGLPYLNLQKPAIGTKVNFKFYHALSQLNLEAVASYDIAAAGGTAENGVKITISEVVLTVPDMYDEAVLNLNNPTAKVPNWDVSGATATDLVLTVSGSSKLNADVLDGGAVKAANQPTGVTATESPVLADNKYFTLIPIATSTTVNVKVTYYVTTDDANLDGGFSRVENIISKDITFANGFGAGKKNSIKMILGISEVALSGEVADWETGSTLEVYLPKNKE